MALHFSSRARLASLIVTGGFVVFGAAACSSASDATPGEEATPNPNGAREGSDCKVGFDCRSGVCSEGRCAPSPASLNSSPTDAEKNGDETDVDCGGSRAPKCVDGKSCEVGGDCTNAICKAGKCVAPAPDDGAKNADETDVDCGGTKAPKCAAGKSCAAHGDCASDACSYEKKCVEFKSCTAKSGGDTCGEGETGDPAAKHESCCTTVKVSDRPAGQGGPFEMDKYHVTAGRMRAFVERYQGNFKQWATENPKNWDDSYTPLLPENLDDIGILLGPGQKRGCNVAAQGGRTYAQDAIDGNAAEKSDFSQSVLDEKALNCVPWYMAAAVCAFDGKRLATAAEMKWVFENRGRAQGATTYPWQFQDNSSYSASAADLRLVHRNSYQTPNPPAGMRTVNGQYPLDHAFWIAPPGRRPKGANMHGIQDAAGNVMTWVNDATNNFTWTMSWENHDKNLAATDWAKNYPDAKMGYYAIGARCVR